MTQKPDDHEVSEDNTSTGAALAKWFAENPAEGTLTAEELAARIREIREGWD